MIFRMSHSVGVSFIEKRGLVCCLTCGHALSAIGKAWKPAARLIEDQLNKMPMETYTTASTVVLRRFYCPACSSLLDTESALRDDPFLNDVLYVDSV
jgi:acetone carboxylase gamma subunit